jgi:hypothetical protein
MYDPLPQQASPRPPGKKPGKKKHYIRRVVIAWTSTKPLDRCGCPAVTDGLDGFCPAPDNDGATPLSEREREVLRHLSGMLSTAEVASEAHITVNKDAPHSHLPQAGDHPPPRGGPLSPPA